MKLLHTLFFIFLATATFSQKPTYLKLEGNSGSFRDSLPTGFIMEDLSWAWNSSNACFVEHQKKKFSGNHKLYIVDLPKYSEMEVTLIPKDKNANMSLYAYEVGKVSADNLVPNLSRCIRCEADFKWDRPVKGKSQDHTRKVSNLVAINNPYQVVIGVAGADGLKEGSYAIEIRMKTR